MGTLGDGKDDKPQFCSITPVQSVLDSFHQHSTIGLDSVNILSVVKHTYSQLANQTFSKRSQVLLLMKNSYLTFFLLSLSFGCCSFEGHCDFFFFFLLSSFQLCLHLSSLVHTHRKLLADAAALGTRRTRGGAAFVQPTERICVCDHREGAMIAYVFSRGPRVLGGPR